MEIRSSLARTGMPDRSPPAGGMDVPPWGVREILLALLAAVCITGLVVVVSSVLLAVLGIPSDRAEHDPLGTAILLLGQLVIDGGAVGAAAWLSLGRYRLSPAAWGLRRQQPVSAPAVAGVLVASFATLLGYQAVVSALGLEALKPESNVPQGLFEHPQVVPLTLLLVVVVAPPAEEMFFRGFLFQGLRRALGTHGAALLSGFAFAAIHIMSRDLIGLLLPFTVIGYLFAVLLTATGSLWNVILVHFAFNLIGVMGELAGAGGVGAAVLLVIVLLLVLGQASSGKGQPSHPGRSSEL
jgi:membrane protease YdiL (CAAX protease family)